MENPDAILKVTFREYWTKRPRVTCRALVEKGGKFLLLFAPWCERWTFPGGGMDGFETPEETMVRELREELGVSAAKIRFLGFSSGKQQDLKYKVECPKLHLIFHTKITKDPKIDESEARDHKWVTLAQMRKMKDLEDGIENFLKRNPKLIP